MRIHLFFSFDLSERGFTGLPELTADGGTIDWVLHWAGGVSRLLLHAPAHGERGSNDGTLLRRMYSAVLLSLCVLENVDTDAHVMFVVL